MKTILSPLLAIRANKLFACRYHSPPGDEYRQRGEKGLYLLQEQTIEPEQEKF